MTTGGKLAIGGAVVVGVTAYMAHLGGVASWQYYLSVEECLAGVAGDTGARVRVGGRVTAGSLEIAADRTQASFSLESSDDAKGELPVVYSGQLPHNMAEQIDVVVEGRLVAAGLLRADKVLTRCASKYEPIQKRAAEDPDSLTRTEAAR